MQCKSLWIKASAKCINVNVARQDQTQRTWHGFSVQMKPCRTFYLQYNQRQIFEYSRGRFLRNDAIWYSSPFMSAMSQNEESRVLSPSALAKVRLQPGSFDFIKSESTQMAGHRHTNNHTHTHTSSPFNTGDNPRHTHARWGMLFITICPTTQQLDSLPRV